MSDYKKNPVFKELLTEISSKASTGRIDLSWGKLEEARKRKHIKNEAQNEPKKPDDKDEEPVEKSVPDKPRGQGNAFAPDKTTNTKPVPDGGAGGEAPPAEAPAEEPPVGGPESAPSGEAPEGTPPEASGKEGGEEASGEEVDKAKDDALAAQAELEKAKAEKGEAEKELEKQSYIHLVSSGGVSFLLGKLVDHAFKTNTIDSLAAEIVQKLKIQTTDEFKLFSDEMIPFKNIPGIPELLASMQGIVGKGQPAEPETPEVKEGMEEASKKDELELVDAERGKVVRVNDAVTYNGYRFYITKITPPSDKNHAGEVEIEDTKGIGTYEFVTPEEIGCEWGHPIWARGYAGGQDDRAGEQLDALHRGDAAYKKWMRQHR